MVGEPEITPVRAAHRFDEAALADFLDRRLGGSAPLRVAQFEGGQSQTANVAAVQGSALVSVGDVPIGRGMKVQQIWGLAPRMPQGYMVAEGIKTAADLKLVCSVGMDCLQLAVTQGAIATVRRSADPEDLFHAIRGAARGSAWYDPTTMTGILAGRREDPTFSARELEVAALIVEGMSNKEISTALRISEPTVKKHVGHILQKLGLADRLQAGLLLARNPLLFRKR